MTCMDEYLHYVHYLLSHWCSNIETGFGEENAKFTFNWYLYDINVLPDVCCDLPEVNSIKTFHGTFSAHDDSPPITFRDIFLGHVPTSLFPQISFKLMSTPITGEMLLTTHTITMLASHILFYGFTTHIREQPQPVSYCLHFMAGLAWTHLVFSHH